MVPDLLFYGGTERRDRTVEFLAPRDLLGLDELILDDGQCILLALNAVAAAEQSAAASDAQGRGSGEALWRAAARVG